MDRPGNQCRKFAAQTAVTGREPTSQPHSFRCARSARRVRRGVQRDREERQSQRAGPQREEKRS